jgi:hypothetical protein
MKGIISLKIKIVLLVVLVGVTANFGWSTGKVKACQTCVPLTGGLCVGCLSGQARGFKDCEPDQSTCSCNVTPGDCDIIDCPETIRIIADPGFALLSGLLSCGACGATITGPIGG